MILIIGLGIVVVTGIVTVYLKNIKKKKIPVKVNLPIQQVQELILQDVIGFFRTLQLDKNKDKPFICTSSTIIEKHITLLDNHSNTTPVLLGVFDSNADEIKPIKLLAVNNISKELVDIMGNDPIIILS